VPADGGPADALTRELRAPLPASVSSLDEAALTDLTAAVRDARHRQAAALAQASEKALGHIPRVLRIPLRKALG
jgi:hypothetical protein